MISEIETLVVLHWGYLVERMAKHPIPALTNQLNDGFPGLYHGCTHTVENDKGLRV
jgi:hypothetical protein